MKDKYIGTVNVYGGIPAENAKMLFVPEPGARRTLGIACGGEVCCYVTGSEAAVLETFISKGMRLFCLRGADTEKENGVQHTVDVFYTPEKI